MDVKRALSVSGALLTPLRIVPGAKGDVLHAIKRSDVGFVAFGEAYFSTVLHGEVKGWNRHLRMTLNLVVPVGTVRFVLRDEREGSLSHGTTEEVTLSPGGIYARLTVPPGIWTAFQGVGKGLNLILDVADLEHDPNEIEKAPLETFPFDWSLS